MEPTFTLEAQVINAITKYMNSGSNLEIWNMEVRPLLRQLAQQLSREAGFKVTTNQTLRTLGYRLTKELIIDTGEALSTRMVGKTILKKIVTKAGTAWIPVAGQVLMVAMLLGDAKDVYAATRSANPQNISSYQDYLERYLGYMARSAELGGHPENYAPPKSYQEWLKRDNSGAWWQ